MITDNHFDYIIIGCGVAGLHLAYQLSEDSFFSNKKIAIIDPDFNNRKNRILSYWEKGDGVWDTILYKSWKKTKFYYKKSEFNLDLTPYTYKSLNFKDFSSYCLNFIKIKPNILLVQDTVVSIKNNKEKVSVFLTNDEISATYVFDSRISIGFNNNKNQYPYVIQSFRGWNIKMKQEMLNDESFVMMDYRKQWKASNSFMYILPKSKSEALFEYTFFAPFTISEEDFDKQIRAYILDFFKCSESDYVIEETEGGEIPMSLYPFSNDSNERIIKIGTSGGWVKASTGYSFKFAEKNARTIINQIKRGELPVGYRQPKRFRFYDKLFIKVLQYQNQKGAKIFNQMYEKTSPELLFKFLDEETTLLEELKIILSLPYSPFLKALL